MRIVNNGWIRSPFEYYDIERGAVAILGNGPTLNDFQLDKLSIPTIGVNRSYKKVKSKYHCFVTPRILNSVLAGWLRGTGAIFCPRDAFVLNRPIATSDPGHSHWGNVGIPYVPVDNNWDGPFHYDLTNSVNASFGGILGIITAMWLGYRDLYLIGFDGDGRHFYDEETHPDVYGQQVVVLKQLRTWLDNHPTFRVYQTNLVSRFNFFDVSALPPSGGS